MHHNKALNRYLNNTKSISHNIFKLNQTKPRHNSASALVTPINCNNLHCVKLEGKSYLKVHLAALLLRPASTGGLTT